MFNILKKNYSLTDLGKLRDKISIDRANFSIALIDDNPFTIVDELRRHRFNITTFDDVENIEMLNSFDIIISDIRGVGKRLGSKFEGAHLIEEIHRQFPNKYLMAYSGSTFNPSYNDYFNLCDVTKRKNIDIKEWVKCLDEAIRNISDPIFQWEKTRTVLLKNKIPINQISKLERSYTRSVLKRNKKYFTKEIGESRSLIESPLVKIAVESILSFASQLISNQLK